MVASAGLESSDPTLLGTASLDEDSARLCIVVVGEGAVATFPLPEAGRITVGRSGHNDIRVDDPLVSREHAAFHVGDGLHVEDLGSANGSKLSNEKLEARLLTGIVPGQVVEVGTTMLVVQHSAHGARPRRLCTHSYFEMRLEEECQHHFRRDPWPDPAADSEPPATPGGQFALMRLHIEGEAPETFVQETLTSVLRPGDVVASYAPGEYELLLLDTNDSRADAESEKLSVALETHALDVRVGIACFPTHGRTPDSLMSAACAAIRGSEEAAPVLDEIIVEDPAMRDLYRVAERIAQGSISVLLLGETGVGKEIFAEAVHRRSPRREQPYVRINCAALSESLLESELFGHEKGAFTGAEHAKPGLLESASGGTVFLDELGEMPAALQVKLLRVIEQRQVLRVGALKPRDIDVRYIAATNRDLEAEVNAGTFRQDLFYRLNGVTLVIPPLRERPCEIERLAKMFLARVWLEMGQTGEAKLSKRALELLLGYRWPGNIRELRNVIERAALLCTGRQIDPEHLPVEKMTATWAPAPSRPNAPATGSFAAQGSQHTPERPSTVPPYDGPPEELEERQRILDALERCGGNQTRAAKELGISRRTLSSRLNKYDIPRPRKRA